jgi:hypothetical protein
VLSHPNTRGLARSPLFSRATLRAGPFQVLLRRFSDVSRHGLEPFGVGRDSITPIDPAYKGEGTFPFTGAIEKVTFELK